MQQIFCSFITWLIVLGASIQLVYMTSSTLNGIKTQLPFSSNPSLAAAGYSDARMIGSWRKVLKAFGDAFPNPAV